MFSNHSYFVSFHPAHVTRIVALFISLTYVVTTTSFSQTSKGSIVRGNKQYEFTSHLGNVVVTISDRSVQIPTPSSGTSGVTAYMLSATDYYAFGGQSPGRASVARRYRYGFNGKENDIEIKGDGNQQDYGFRVYDPRLGKFLSVDPLTRKYPELTPYQFASNTPIQAIDLDGLEAGDAKGGKPAATKANDKTTGKTEAVVASIKASEPAKDISTTNGASNTTTIGSSEPNDMQSKNRLFGLRELYTDAEGFVDEDKIKKYNEDHVQEFKAAYGEGNLRLDFTPMTDSKGNTSTRKYQLGIVNKDGTEIIIAEAISDKSGSINGDFKRTQNDQRLFMRVEEVTTLSEPNISGGTSLSATTNAAELLYGPSGDWVQVGRR